MPPSPLRVGTPLVPSPLKPRGRDLCLIHPSQDSDSTIKSATSTGPSFSFSAFPILLSLNLFFRPYRSSSAMASYISVPCPKFPTLLRNASSHGVPMVSRARISLQGRNEKKFHGLSAKTHEAIAESSSNSLPLATAKPETLSPEDKDVEAKEESTIQSAISDSEISAFMSEVSNIVKLVDSRDITELHLKRKDCELIIRKKEALPQSAPASSVVMMQPPQGMYPAPSYASHAFPTTSSPPPSASSLALPPPKGTKSSLPALKSPVAGTFYRSPAPGEPPFVQVGDKVKKGQVVCIIEAMKLMNEIEADQSGTVVEIIAVDGKPVSVETPLLIIEP